MTKPVEAVEEEIEPQGELDAAVVSGLGEPCSDLDEIRVVLQRADCRGPPPRGFSFVVIAAWFAILFTGRFPRGMFDFLVGVGRWTNRVIAYAHVLVTDRYPPFRLAP